MTRGKKWRKTSWCRVENQQTQPTYDTESGNQTRAPKRSKAVKVVVEKLVTFLNDGGVRVAGSEETEVLQKIRAVFGSEEWVEIPG